MEVWGFKKLIEKMTQMMGLGKKSLDSEHNWIFFHWLEVELGQRGVQEV